MNSRLSHCHAGYLAKDSILESLAGDDLDDLLGLDLDLLAGHGVASDASGTLDEFDLAEAGEHVALLFLLGALDREIDETIINCDSLLFADFTGFGERSHDTALGGGDDFFLSHFLDP